MNRHLGTGILLTLILIAMLAPIWIGIDPPIYDYPNHLLEAQVVSHYNDPDLDYASGYDVRPNWFLESNALGTLLLIGLAYVMPITLAGRLVLSFYLLLFLGGVVSLTRRHEARWMWLLCPILAYNFTFTSGWINFSYGVALSLYALGCYLRWQERNHKLDAIFLCGLLILIYTAHLVAWVLVVATIAALSAVEAWSIRRQGILLAVISPILPMLSLTRPALACLAFMVAPTIWCVAAIVRRLRVDERRLSVVAIGLMFTGALMIKFLKPTLNTLVAEVTYSTFNKKMYLLRLLALPHQTNQPDLVLSVYNLVQLGLLVGLAGIVWRSTTSRTNDHRQRYLAALGVLGILYIVIPSSTSDILLTEPRVALYLIIVLLLAIRWPPEGTRYREWAAACVIVLFCCHLTVSVRYAILYEREAQRWRTELSRLQPARSILMLRSSQPREPAQPVLFRLVNSYYDGEHFSTMYTLYYGGFISRIFDSGPVQPRSTTLVPFYYWPGFDGGMFVHTNCMILNTQYDTVLVWGKPTTALATELDACFERGQQLDRIAIWRSKPAE